jgi:hypothetical protein
VMTFAHRAPSPSAAKGLRNDSPARIANLCDTVVASLIGTTPDAQQRRN